MPMSFANGRMVITDGGHVVFDSDEGLLQVISKHTGTITTTDRQARYRYGVTQSDIDNPVDVDQDYVLDSIHPEANVVIGSFKASALDNRGVAATSGWYNASGTYVHWQSEESFPIQAIAAYTFRADSGALILNERVCMYGFLGGLDWGDTTVTVTLRAVQFDYFLMVGRFT